MKSRTSSPALARARSPIAIDYTAGPGHAPGEGRYVRELVRALCAPENPAEHPAEHQLGSTRSPLELLEYGRASTPMEGEPLGLPSATAGEESPAIRRRRIRLPRRLIALGRFAPPLARALWGPTPACSLFHRTRAHWPPIGAVPYSLPVLDLPPPGTQLDERFGAACQGARGVIVFSRDAGERVASRYGLADSAVHFAPVGSEHWQRDAHPAGTTARDPRPDVLVLGGLRQDRHPRRALRAFERLLERRSREIGPAPRLLFIGHAGDEAGAFTEALRDSKAREHVRWIADPEEARMPGAVGGAAALLHLADDECSPVTPLEAARMGLAVVASPLPAFLEALGDRAAYVSPEDTDGLAEALGAALSTGMDPAFREVQRRVVEPFTWAKCAGAHRRAWELMIP